MRMQKVCSILKCLLVFLVCSLSTSTLFSNNPIDTAGTIVVLGSYEVFLNECGEMEAQLCEDETPYYTLDDVRSGKINFNTNEELACDCASMASDISTSVSYNATTCQFTASYSTSCTNSLEFLWMGPSTSTVASPCNGCTNWSTSTKSPMTPWVFGNYRYCVRFKECISVTPAESSWVNSTCDLCEASISSSLNSSSYLCSGFSEKLTARMGNTSPFTYKWSTGATTNNITVSPTVTTSYSVTITNGVGCTDTYTTSVKVKTCTRYDCSGGNCSLSDNSGYSSLSRCEENCLTPVEKWYCIIGSCDIRTSGNTRAYDTESECSSNCVSNSKWTCNANGCNESHLGQYSTRALCEDKCDCISNCDKYKCVGDNCVRDDLTGTYNFSNCNNECGLTTPKYKCNGSICLRDDVNGNYTNLTCNGACAVTTIYYSCNTSSGICSTATSGYTSLSSCNQNCDGCSTATCGEIKMERN